MVDIKLDTTGKKCPMPVLMTKKELRKMASGQTLELISDDVGSKKDVPALLTKLGDQLLETKEESGKYIYLIKKS